MSPGRWGPGAAGGAVRRVGGRLLGCTLSGQQGHLRLPATLAAAGVSGADWVWGEPSTSFPQPQPGPGTFSVTGRKSRPSGSACSRGTGGRGQVTRVQGAGRGCPFPSLLVSAPPAPAPPTRIRALGRGLGRGEQAIVWGPVTHQGCTKCGARLRPELGLRRETAGQIPAGCFKAQGGPPLAPTGLLRAFCASFPPGGARRSGQNQNKPQSQSGPQI